MALAMLVNLLSINRVIAQSDSIDIHPPFLSPTNPTVVDLLSGTLNNRYGAARFIHLYATVEKNSAPIGSGKCSAFTLYPGSLLINSMNAEGLLGTVDGHFSGQDRDYVQRTGTIPPGNYWICIYAVEENTDDTLGHTCYDHTVMDLNPPILVLPSNGEVVDVPFPTFVWTPPTPLNVVPTYRLRLVQLLGNQSPVAALGSNTAFHDVDGLMTNLYQYPIAARQLENGRRYVWQVAVYHNDALITQSEIFTFTYRNPTEDDLPDPSLTDKLIMVVGQTEDDTLIERTPEGLQFYKENGELQMSELGFFKTPVTVYHIMDKDHRDLSNLIVFEKRVNGGGYRLRFMAPGNQAGQSYEYLQYVTPGGEVFTYKFRE